MPRLSASPQDSPHASSSSNEREAGKPSFATTLRRRCSRYFRPRAALALLIIAVVLTASAHVIEREWAGWLGERVPPSWVQTASTRALARLDATELTASHLSAQQQNAITTRFGALKLPQGETPPYALVFRHGGSYGARSFTLAGGQIIVTDELVAQSGSERALLAELAVQLGHLQNHDALRSAVDHASLGMLLALFRSDAETGIRIMANAQPVLEHEAHCEEEAHEFSQAVMRANP